MHARAPVPYGAMTDSPALGDGPAGPAKDADPVRRRPANPYDVDGDGRVTDTDLALVTPPSFWRLFGLRGPGIILRWVGRNGKRLAVAVVGSVFLLGGLAMIVLPGPGVIVSLIGLAILATEFAWAERALDHATERTAQVAGTVSSSRAGRGMLVLSGTSLCVAGVAALVVLDRFRFAGVGLIVAGVAALVTLAPQAQRWLDRERAKSDARRVERAPRSE